jgi:forkhead protein FKH
LKKQTNGTRLSQKQRKISPEPNLPHHESPSSPAESEHVDNKDLVESVISYLQVASHQVAAVSEHANDKIDEAEKVTAYAKIAGRDWTYFVVGQNVNIGRPPDKDPDAPAILPSSPLVDMKELLPVHIDLGPSKYVSRHHACVFYDAEFPENGGWHLRVVGRNGVRVNNHLLKRNDSHQLTSGDIMEIAGTQMMFVTPADKAIIDPSFVERAKMAASGAEEWAASQHAHPHPQTSNLPAGSLYPTTAHHPPLAPAPAYFKRAVTPPAAQKDSRGHRGVFDSKPPQSPMYNRGMMMESTQDIDYSQDAAKDLKPPFSYATMIAQAIFSNEEEKLTLSNIYGWISDKYAFYRHSNSGWQVNEIFLKLDGG